MRQTTNNKLSYYKHRRRGCVAQWFNKYTPEQDNPLELKIYQLMPRMLKCKTLKLTSHQQIGANNAFLTKPHPSNQTTAPSTLVQQCIPTQPNHNHQHIGTKYKQYLPNQTLPPFPYPSDQTAATNTLVQTIYSQSNPATPPYPSNQTTANTLVQSTNNKFQNKQKILYTHIP